MPRVLLHIPHASTSLPEEWRSLFFLNEEELKREIVKMTDLYTDELFDMGTDADKLRFPVSRLLVDPERFENDEDEPMAPRGMGAVYTRTHDGKPLKSAERRAELMKTFYAPHHQALHTWTAAALAVEQRCLIIDCHSFPSSHLPCDLNPLAERLDICLGTSAPHTSDALVSVAVRAFTNSGFTVSVDEPYAGTIVPIAYFGAEPKVSSLMVEVNRRLFTDEESGERSDGFAETKQRLQRSLNDIVASWVAQGS